MIVLIVYGVLVGMISALMTDALWPKPWTAQRVLIELPLAAVIAAVVLVAILSLPR